MENTELQLVVSSAQGTVEQNRLSLENANKAADKLIALIEETEIQDNPLVRNLDEQCKSFLAKASKTAQTMSERRKPITQAFDQIRKYFTEMENSAQSGIINATSGNPRPVSHFETVFSETSSRSASSRCVHPFSCRNALINAPVIV